MNLRDRLFGDDDKEDPHANMDEVAEHGVNSDEDKEVEDDGSEYKPAP